MRKRWLLILVMAMSWMTLCASTSDSIRNFLIGIGEVEPYISIAVNQKKPLTFEQVYATYCRGLHFISTKGECQVAEYTVDHRYVIERIVNDTMVELLGIMPQGYNFLDNCDSLIACYRYAMEHYNSVEAGSSLMNIYYQRLRNAEHSIENEMLFLYSAMASCVLGYSYDIVFRESLSHISKDSTLLAEERMSNAEFQKLFSVSKSQYYQYLPEGMSFRILSPSEQEEFEALLTTGAQLGSHWCQVRLASALIVGVLLKKDIKRGRDILVSVWPSMKDSPFWNYINDNMILQ